METSNYSDKKIIISVVSVGLLIYFIFKAVNGASGFIRWPGLQEKIINDMAILPAPFNTLPLPYSSRYISLFSIPLSILGAYGGFGLFQRKSWCVKFLMVGVIGLFLLSSFSQLLVAKNIEQQELSLSQLISGGNYSPSSNEFKTVIYLHQVQSHRAKINIFAGIMNIFFTILIVAFILSKKVKDELV